MAIALKNSRMAMDDQRQSLLVIVELVYWAGSII
jgi:hypothetical protein